MTLSTNLISGLSSGFDWRSMIDQLIAIEHKPVDSVNNQISEYQSRLSQWQSFSTMLLSLNTASKVLSDTEKFNVYISSMSTNSTLSGSDLLSISTADTASPGTYAIKVETLAASQKLSSNSFSSQTEGLGSGYEGDIVINGKVLRISGADSLMDVAYNINRLNVGSDSTRVTAAIVKYATNDYRLILTSEETGAAGISLLNGDSAGLVQKFGWKDNQAAQVKSPITNGVQSGSFAGDSGSIQSLLGLAVGEASTGTLSIDGTAVAINLAADSLNDIRDAINAAMALAGKGNQVQASVVPDNSDGRTGYRLQIEGTQSFSDEKNILNTLGILDHTSASVTGKVSGNSMTANGAFVTSQTLLSEIDGYISYTAGDRIRMTGAGTNGELVDFTLEITASTRVSDLLSAIETQYAAEPGDATAYVTADGKIRVDDVSGSENLSVTLTDQLTSGRLEFVDGDLAFGEASVRKREIVAGRDAAVEIDGVVVTSSSNSIKDVLTGVTLNLLKEDASTTITLTIGRDLEAVKTNIKDFVSKYNSVMTFINSQFSYNQDTQEKGGILFGDGTLSSIKSDLTSILTQSIWGVNSGFSILGLVGITVDNKLLLNIDEGKLGGYLQTNFNDILSLFADNGTASGTGLLYVNHTRDTAAGEYLVHIDQAATQAVVTGSVDLSAGGADETLTISQGDSTAVIDITSDMTLEEIKNAINAEFNAEFAETLVGDQQLMEGGIAASAQTIWTNLDGTTLVSGDVISFAGTSRSGAEISGSYMIGDVESDSIQGLLSEIEKAYSGSVTAAMDTSGRIVVTDKLSGYSQISFSIDGPTGSGLSFGAVDVTPGAFDGSCEGRYAMTLTGTDDGNGHLVIRSNDYGNVSFTISQDTFDLGLINGTFSGQDVAGTINGEEAQGSGCVLTGISSNPNTAGLAVRYSGSDNNIDAGTIKVTIGVAELFERSLYGITDSLEGYVPFKQKSLQGRIKALENQVTQMEDRLNRKMEAMVNRFAAMEVALAKIQSMSEWLSGQVSAASNGWASVS